MPNAYLSLTGVDANPGSRLAAGFSTTRVLYPRAADGVNVTPTRHRFRPHHESTFQFRISTRRPKIKMRAATPSGHSPCRRSGLLQLSRNHRSRHRRAKRPCVSRQTLVDKIQALTNAKLKSDIDLSFSNVDLARGKLLLLEAQNNYQTSLAALSAILGYPDEQNFQLVEETTAVPQPAADVAAADSASASTASRNQSSAISGRVRAEIWQRRARSCAADGERPRRRR